MAIFGFAMTRAALTAFFLLSGSAARFAVESEDDGILIMDEANFDAIVAEHQHGILVDFYAPWCGHCKKLAPEYKKAAATLLRETDPPVRLGMVDAIEEEELALKYGVSGFPTLKFFREGNEPTEYEGGRTERDIVAYLKKRTGPPATFVRDSAELAKALKRHSEVLIVGFFTAEEIESGYQGRLFMDLAAAVDEYEFVHTPDASIAMDESLFKALDVVEEAELQGSIVILKNYDERRSVLPVKPGIKLMEAKQWVLRMSTPKLMQFSQDRSRQIFKGPVKVHMLTFVDTAATYMDALKKTLTTLSDDRRGEILHVYVPSSEDRVMNYFGLDKKELPRTIIVDVSRSDGGAGSMKKYLFTGSKLHTLGELRQFENDYFAGALSPLLKSEDSKPSDMRGKVKIVTGNTFQADVAENVEHDVLLMFYAPWCGHCKALMPKWDDLGDMLSGVTKETKDNAPFVAKMDATANEIDETGIIIRGFPTIYYFPADKQQPPELYDGGRETGDFVTFLQRRATKFFELNGGLRGGPGFHDEL
jgi:protein disulfide-isomerase A1